jgi:hypothetical protein
MAAAAEARAWLMENLAGPGREHTTGSEYRQVVAAYVGGLPDDDPELIRVAGLLDSYDHGPGRRPDISLNGDDEDTADVIAEILDDDETALDSDDGIGCHGGTTLSRQSPAAFLHDLVLSAAAWLAQDAVEVDRLAGK